MLKNAMSSDSSTDIAAFKEILIKFCTSGFRSDTIHLFKLTWMFAFVKNQAGDKCPMAAGEVLRKAAGKAMAIECMGSTPWNGVNIVVPDG